MTWTAYRVVFKLRSPMHIGCGKVGNVQRTRPYVTGRNFWGALTMRLTRDATQGSAVEKRQYECYGNKVSEQLTFTYFYIATKSNGDYQIAWTWENESLLRRRFLSSYTSTALVYPQQVAEEGFLHEVEFISPRTLDNSQQVYLVGYVLKKEGCKLKWEEACHRLQMGGERGYGWGDVQCVEVGATNTQQLFHYYWHEQNGSVVIDIPDNSPVLAHTETTKNLSAQGEIEPLVGREWKEPNQAGESVAFSGMCWTPGSVVSRSSCFKIKEFGIWQQWDGEIPSV